MTRMLNFVIYEIGWFACVLGSAFSREPLGIAIALSLVAVHFALTNQRAAQGKIILVSFAVGLVVDSTLLGIGVYRFPGESIASWLPPLWMSVLWIQFATTFRYCLHWLSERYILCSLLGFVGAPLAFLGGERLGAISFLEPRFTNLLILGTLWAVAIPLLIYVSDRIHSHSRVVAGYRGLATPD